MDGPGMSLFQGAASIHINNSAQDRLEEQEELEDQKRRNVELKHNLENAFDDLHDDDEASSVNSSGNFTLDAGQTNGNQQTRHNMLPPTYVESLNHLKDVHHTPPNKRCEMQNNHHVAAAQLRHQEEPVKLPYSPYGAGDGQNHYFHQEYRGHLNGIDNFDHKQEYMNTEQIKVLYDMRVKEYQQQAVQIEKLDSEIEKMRARLGAAINDRDKAELSLQEAHHLLASSKHKEVELEQQVTALTEKLVASEHGKEQLLLELRSASVSLQDAQQRLHTFQVSHSHDTDALFREQQGRHREEMDKLQNDLVKTKNWLDRKENELKQMEQRCMEKDREKEDILIEKGVTINKLAAELEAAQSQLARGETARLKEKLSQLTTERNASREQVKELGSKLELTAHELVLNRNKLAACQKEYENWRSTLHHIMLECLPENSYVGEPPSPGKLSTLKDVLARYKQQIQKLPALQEELEKRDKKLEVCRKQKSELTAKVEELKGVEMQLQSRLAVLQNKLELLGSNSDSELVESYKQQNDRLQAELEETKAELKKLDSKYTELESEHSKLQSEKGSRASLVQEANADLMRELESNSAQLKEALKQNRELKSLYLKACSSRDSVGRMLKDQQSKWDKEKETYTSQEKQYAQTIETHKEQVERLSSELSSAKNDLESANKRISELQKELNEKQKEFTDKLDKYLADEEKAMRKEMAACPQCEQHLEIIRQLQDQVAKFNLKMASQESNEALMKELKKKAEFFHLYIMERFQQISEQRTVGTNTESLEAGEALETPTQTETDSAVQEKQALNGDEVILSKDDLLSRENSIRNQIAEKFTKEIKNTETNCELKLKEYEKKFTTNLNYYKGWLVKKYNEIEVLKEYVLSERETFEKICHAKEKELHGIEEKLDQVQSENWKLREAYKENLTKINLLEDSLRKERECSKERSKDKIVDLENKIQAIEDKFQRLLDAHLLLQKKHKNNKKTIMTYKDYMAKKDAHVANEMNRIQDEYRKIFLRLQAPQKGTSTADRPSPDDYIDNLNKLNDDFAKLSHSVIYRDPNIDDH